MRTTRQLIVPALLVLLIAGAFALGLGVQALTDGAPAARDREGDRASRFRLLDEVYEILDRDFVEPDRVNPERLRTAAISGIVNALNDPHSVYLDAARYRIRSEDISGEFEGIGATVTRNGDAIVIAGTFPGSPAEAAGLRRGDVILAVDGESTEGSSLQLAVIRIRGPRGTDVGLTVRHRNGEEETLTVTRDRIVVPSVHAPPIQDAQGTPVNDIAYLIITRFTENTRGELLPFLECIKNAGLGRLIIDVRGNAGGLVSAAVDTIGEFIDQGVILTRVSRDGSHRNFEDTPGGAGLHLKLVLLVDGNSASGAEIMAAALRDHERAVIVGEQTLGKGTVTVPRALSDGSALYISIARWLTPHGKLIEGVGVIPDIIVEPTDLDFEMRRDVQLFAALDFLRGVGGRGGP